MLQSPRHSAEYGWLGICSFGPPHQQARDVVVKEVVETMPPLFLHGLCRERACIVASSEDPGFRDKARSGRLRLTEAAVDRRVFSVMWEDSGKVCVERCYC